jgi:hypothetical protein
MLSPDRLLRVTIEVLFVLLGGLVVWLGVTRRIFFDRWSLGWLAISVILVLWGARGLWKPSHLLSRGESWTRGVSLILLGLVMLAISKVSVALVGPLLTVVGGLLLTRGLVGAVLIFGEKSPQA